MTLEIDKFEYVTEEIIINKQIWQIFIILPLNLRIYFLS